MIRTQIQLTEQQAARIKRIALERGVSMATVIRDAVDQLADDHAERRRAEAWDRFGSVIGRFHGGRGNVAEQHDAQLARAYEDWG